MKQSLKQLNGRLATNKPTIKRKQKASNGLQEVSVPEAGSGSDVASSTLSGAATGASLGSAAGPWGTVIGGVVGAGYGAVTGVINKDEADREHKEAVEKNEWREANRRYDGVDQTINQKQQVFKKGSMKIKAKKPIEVEDGEHHFDSKLNHKGLYKGAKHEEGGIDTVVEEGDSIIPAKHEKVVTKAIKEGDKNKIRKIRSKLPKDTPNGKAGNGAKIPGYNTIDGESYWADDMNHRGMYGQADDAFQNGNWLLPNQTDVNGTKNKYKYPVVANQRGTMYRADSMPKIKPIVSKVEGGVTNSPIPTEIKTQMPVDTNYNNSPTSTTDTGLDSKVGNLAKYANTANNLIRGFQKTPKVEESYLDPELLKYTDRSESVRKASRETAMVDSSNARNLAGGNVGNMRSNQTAAYVANLGRQDAINEKEMQRADQIDQVNVGIKNSAKQVNLTRKDQYKDINDRNRAARDSYLDQAAQDITNSANANEQTKYIKSRDAKLDELEGKKLKVINGMTKYSYDTEGNRSFTPKNGGGSIGSTNTTTSNTTRVNTEGKTSTSSTSRTAPLKPGKIVTKGGAKIKLRRK